MTLELKKTDRQGRHDRQTGKQTDRKADRQTDRRSLRGRSERKGGGTTRARLVWSQMPSYRERGRGGVVGRGEREQEVASH